jgi:ERF superfamily
MSMHSESINELAKALALAQGEIRGASEDKINPHFKSSYASLASVWDACREPLSKNGLSIIQNPDMINGELFLITMLLHSSGQWMKSTIPVSNPKGTPHALGSSLTYMRRYSLSAMVGVAPCDDATDDDANAIQAVHEKPKSKTPIVLMNSEPVKSIGYDAFITRFDLRPGTQIYEYLRYICSSTHKSEVEMVNAAMKNESKFMDAYTKWYVDKSVCDNVG